jgi:LysM repeat protein
MNKWPASWRIILILVLVGIAGGCMPTSDGPIDDEKEPNFVEGRNHQNAMDYKGAIAAFERTVQANPRNAAAHFELGLLYEQKMGDFVSAIYHFQRHLQLRPKSEHLDVVNQHITTCKLELAKTVTFAVINGEVHRDLVRLTNELAQSREMNEVLKKQIAARPTIVTQWNTIRVTQYVNVMVTNQIPPRPVTNYSAPIRTTNVVTPLRPTNTVTRVVPAPKPAPAPRSYQVHPGDTMAVIARRYGVSVDKIRAANPTVQPTKIRAGQVLIIPPE